MSMSDLDIMLRQLHDLIGQLLSMRDGTAAPPREPAKGYGGDDVFNFQDKAHRLAAEHHFKRLKINEKRQAYYYNRLLVGVRLGDLAAVIEAEDAEYKRRYPPRPQGGQGHGGWRGRG